MILVVCEGNVCRSPVAAVAFTRALADLPEPPAVASAGTRALVGAGADPLTADVAARAGLDVSGHRARQLDRALVASAGLVLAASRRIRSEVVELHPPAIQYVFTLRQLARIVADHEPAGAELPVTDRLRELRSYAARHRGLRVTDPAEDDVRDPIGQPVRVHEEAVGQILPAVRSVVRALGGPPPPSLG